MKMFTIFALLIVVTFAQLPASIVNKIHEVGNKRINEVKQLRTNAEQIENKMDQLLEKALLLRRAKTQKEIEKRTSEANKMIQNYTQEEQKKMTDLVKKYETVSKQTIESGKKIKEMKEKDYNAHVKLLKYLKQQVIKETKELEKKRAQMEASRKREAAELRKAIRAIRVARMKGMRQAANAAKRRHELLKKAAQEEKKRMKEEIEERKKIIAAWKTRMADLEQREEKKMRTLKEIQLERKRRAMYSRIAQNKEEAERRERFRKMQKEREAKIRLQNFKRSLFKKRCEELKNAYNKQPKKIAHLCLPKSNIQLLGKMRKCLPIWKQDVPTLKQKLDRADFYRRKIVAKHPFIDPQVDLIVPVY